MKLLYSENQRLQDLVSKLEKFKDKYQESKVEIAKLKQFAKSYSYTDALYALCLAIGPLIIGVASGLTGKLSTILSIIGLILISVAFVAKFKHKYYDDRGDAE